MEKDNLRLIVLDNCKEFGDKVNKHLNNIRGENKNYIVPIDNPRFSNGEGKAKILDTIRSKDVYIISDTNNYNCTYKMHGIINHKSPDDHFQDIKRVIGAMMGHASSVTVIMPMLYASRQHRRKSRESLDCAMALQELENMGIKGIITFDAHDPNVQNAIPYLPFENIYPTNAVLSKFIDDENIDFRKLLIISPDEGAMSRARYYADMLKADVGMFYKRRDLSKIVNGKNPIVAHEYLGKDVKGLNVMIVDDMIASGSSMLEVAEELKNRGANKVYLTATFALFNDGIDKFKDAYDKGYFDKLYTTNLTYINEKYKNEEWLKSADCSRLLAKYIDTLNKQQSISNLANGKEKILKKLDEKNKI